MQKEKEEKEKAFQEELNKLSPEEQFYYIKEMPTKASWVEWKEDNYVAGIKIKLLWIEHFTPIMKPNYSKKKQEFLFTSMIYQIIIQSQYLF